MKVRQITDEELHQHNFELVKERLCEHLLINDLTETELHGDNDVSFEETVEKFVKTKESDYSQTLSLWVRVTPLQQLRAFFHRHVALVYRKDHSDPTVHEVRLYVDGELKETISVVPVGWRVVKGDSHEN